MSDLFCPKCDDKLNAWSIAEGICLKCGHEGKEPQWEYGDSINPSHYKSHPSGVECIQITEHMGFTLGNAMKYIWRADLKHDDGGVEDLKKAQWYIERELQKRSNPSE